MITYNCLVSDLKNYPYIKRSAHRCIILCKKSSNGKIVEDSKLELFRMLGRVVVKNVDNFFYLTSKMNKEIFHTQDDIVGESYLIFDNCLNKFDLKLNKDFYWYFNKSLTRRILRIIERKYHKHMNVDCVDQSNESHMFVNSNNSTIDFTDYYLDKLGLTDEEQKIVYSKLKKEKVSDFLDTNPDITWNKYFKCLGEVKNKLKPLKDER